MDGLSFERDIRSTEPDATAHRRARFKVGWREATEGGTYGADALAELTWQNLGYRLGRLFGPTTVELQDEMYDLCVKLQAQKSQ